MINQDIGISYKEALVDNIIKQLGLGHQKVKGYYFEAEKVH